MNKTLFYGIVLTLLILGGMVYWFWQTIPTEQAVESLLKDIKAVNPNLLSDNTVATLKKMEKNGEIPVTTANKVTGKTDPFQ